MNELGDQRDGTDSYGGLEHEIIVPGVVCCEVYGGAG